MNYMINYLWIKNHRFKKYEVKDEQTKYEL